MIDNAGHEDHGFVTHRFELWRDVFALKTTPVTWPAFNVAFARLMMLPDHLRARAIYECYKVDDELNDRSDPEQSV
ncbi:hypothetical protein CLV63_1643 [Murinocardiopsis flavida]|uniref:Uncharacterized protein n=1 Tax=Murinocardiopsis flavida TaxID=645275 RepID=A0A2P8C5C7_9ACTN|nr:hypothetical protein [Murinocardiopsis flavida]PSK80164.1 hypothetical protein CLV63_1643 [Murinocardiopsis flavida]